jgi:Flp pilus assembly protein TadD
MKTTVKSSLRLALALLAIGATGGAAGVAQVAQPPAAAAPGAAEDPNSALSRHLTTLANNPQSVLALTGAGRAALELGDGQAALSFFVRAEELAPNDGRVKAGVGSALVLMEQGQAALQFFGEAARLGVPAHEFAGDRGLAYDLIGNSRAAQRDYQLVLARGENAEVRRRLALSQAIGGDRKAALATIEHQLRRQDRAAWRVQVFVLALTGDTAGATRTVQAMMPHQAAALQPFLARLPTLSPAERAMAVHFGHFPGDPMVAAEASPVPAGQPAIAAGASADAAVRAGQPDSGQPPLGSAPAVVRAPAASAKTPAVVAAAPPVTAALAPTRTVQLAEAGPRAPPAEPAKPVVGPPDESALVLDTPSSSSPAGQPASIPSSTPAIIVAADVDPRPGPAGGAALAPSAGSATVTKLPSEPESTAPIRNFADVATLIAALPVDPQIAEPAATPEKKPAAKPAAAKAKPKPAEARPATPKEPKRTWVQVASGANATTLPREYERLKSKAPKLFARRTAWTAPLRATNRLLVGPFKDEKEAKAFVNELSKANLSAFSWTSAEGQEIKKLATK